MLLAGDSYGISVEGRSEAQDLEEKDDDSKERQYYLLLQGHQKTT